jgi:pentatricopeptide repeat protein
MRIYIYAISLNLFGILSWNAIMDGYMQRKQMAEAQKLFDKMPEKNNVSWNTINSGYTMLTDYAIAAMIKEAREMIDKMPHRSYFLVCCAGIY